MDRGGGAVVVPTRELRHITWQVLPAHGMIRAVIPTLEQGPERLDAIGMCHGIHVFAHRMFHGCVLERQSIMRAGIIRIHGRPRTDSLDHELLQRGAIGTRHHGCTHAIGRPIFQADHRRLAHDATPGVPSRAGVLGRLLATHLGLVHFHRSRVRVTSIFPGASDSMRQVPGGLPGHAQIPMQFHA